MKISEILCRQAENLQKVGGYAWGNKFVTGSQRDAFNYFFEMFGLPSYDYEYATDNFKINCLLFAAASAEYEGI